MHIHFCHCLQSVCHFFPKITILKTILAIFPKILVPVSIAKSIDSVRISMCQFAEDKLIVAYLINCNKYIKMECDTVENRKCNL